MNVWFTADLHLGHARILELCHRPWPDVEAMNRGLVERWNLAVAADDLVFVLGDLALGRLADSLQWAAQLRGQKLLVPGNHDRCWEGHRRVRPADRQVYVDAGFEILDGYYRLTNKLVLCHFPAAGDSQPEDRFLTHRPQLGPQEWLLHGHVHQAWQIRDRHLNVGVDVWDYTPVPLRTVQAMINFHDAEAEQAHDDD